MIADACFSTLCTPNVHNHVVHKQGTSLPDSQFCDSFTDIITMYIVSLCANNLSILVVITVHPCLQEVNELINMFFNIGEAIPQERLANIKQAESGNELLSLLSSVRLSVQVSISTPLQCLSRHSH